MPDSATTWNLIHTERAVLADTLDGLTPEQWATPSLCAGWSIQLAAGHVLAGAEQTGLGFTLGMIASGFRFNAMVARDVQRLGALPPPRSSAGSTPGPRPRITRPLLYRPCSVRSWCTARTSAGRSV